MLATHACIQSAVQENCTHLTFLGDSPTLSAGTAWEHGVQLQPAINLKFSSCHHISDPQLSILLIRRRQEDRYAYLQDGHLLPGSFQLDLPAERKQDITARQGLLCSLNPG